jgi:hypothetical protein
MNCDANFFSGETFFESDINLSPMDLPPPRWRTYGRFVVWTFPALLALFFSNRFLLPKLEKIYEKYGIDLPDEESFRQLVSWAQFFREYAWFLLIGFGVIIGIAEVAGRNRPGIRSGIYEGAAWIFNAAVLVHLILVAIWALLSVTAPGANPVGSPN